MPSGDRFPNAVTASGNGLCGQQSTNSQTKGNNTLRTDTRKQKETENRHAWRSCHTDRQTSSSNDVGRTKPHRHPDRQPPWPCRGDSQVVREKLKTSISSRCRTDTVYIATGRKSNKNQCVMKAKIKENILHEFDHCRTS